jgi:hypothetical protein
VLLYSPAARRATLAALLAVAEEIGSGVGRSLEHTVQHLRLDWWRRETERFERAEPQHPWLRALQMQQPDSQRLDLRSLVDAAAQDLATRTLASRAGSELQRALFVLVARMLEVPADSATLQSIGALGELSQRLEAAAAQVVDDAQGLDALLRALQRHAQLIDSALQPRLAPLLVWSALAAAHARRRLRRRHAGSRLDGLRDNLRAWQAARLAARGRFRILAARSAT